MLEWLALVPVGGIIFFLGRQAILRHQKWNDRYWTRATALMLELEPKLPSLLPVLSMPIKQVRQTNGNILHTRQDDKTIIDFMIATNHRPALHLWHNKLLEAGLVRLAYAIALYASYTGVEGDKWWRRQWWTGARCLDHPELLRIERTIRRVYEDTRRALRHEPAAASHETWGTALSARPLVEFPRHWLVKPHRIPRDRWRDGREPRTIRARITRATATTAP